MPRRFVRSACAAAALTVAAALASPAAGAAAFPAAPAPPGEQSVSELLTQLKTLYRQAEEATESYNETEEKLRKQRKRTKALNAALARARTELSDSHVDAGRLARQQYRDSGGLSEYSPVLSLLSDKPDLATEQRRELRRKAGHQSSVVERLTSGEKRADALATKARAALDKQQALTAKRKKKRDDVKKRLARIEKRLASLSGRQLGDIRRLEEQKIDEAQFQFLSSGALDPAGGPPAGGPSDAPSDAPASPPASGPAKAPAKTSPKAPASKTPRAPSRKPSSAGKRALRYASKQIGKPYVWGAEGPDSFDCSGLTSRAWAHAGRRIPRTSQEQWRKLPRVSLRKLRPGDLVIYFARASHVAMYAGNGMVVQAPRPGARVKKSPIASNPLRGAVRPG